MNSTLGSAASAPLTYGAIRRLTLPLDGYSRATGRGLATQVAAGRHLRIVETAERRLRVRLLEDGYPCWLDRQALAEASVATSRPAQARLSRAVIASRLDRVLAFAEAARLQSNHYLWGGTLGPDFDCSGLVQTAFASAGIWLPRDAYLQERFCLPVAVQGGMISLLQPGDLIFFGSHRRCTHVGLHLGGGRYLHSSGREHGRNGIGIDDLNPRNPDPVACHYRRELRGAGRVMHSHDGSPMPD